MKDYRLRPIVISPRAKRRENYTPKEEDEQKALIQWCEFNAQKYRHVNRIYAVPNGGSRNEIEARNLKLSGVKAGVPDLFLPVPMHGKHGLYIEMKRKQGGKVSEKQKDWLEFLASVGYETAVCKGLDEAIAVIEKYYKGESNE